MASIYKSERGETAIQERYLQFLDRWPVANKRLRIATRQGETHVVACGPSNALPVILLHGSAANSAMWMGDVAVWAKDFRVFAVDVIGEPGLSASSRPPLPSQAYALWLDDVMAALSLDCASFEGISLGGWLALDYATRQPERVQSLVMLCPGGIGRQKVGIALKTIPLRFLGRWGTKKARELVLGPTPANIAPTARPFVDFIALIHEQFRPRVVKMPIMSDTALKRLTMPVLAILGGKDVILDSAETKHRIEHTVPHAKILYYPESGHLLPTQTSEISDFLREAVRQPYR